MAVARFHSTCGFCKKSFFLRIQIGYEPIQIFAAPCPECGSLLRGTFEPHPSGAHRLRSDHFEENPTSSMAVGDPFAYPTLNVAVDLPMEAGFVHQQSPMTPFMAVQSFLPETWFETEYPRLHPHWKEINRSLEPLVEAHVAGKEDLFDLQAKRLRREANVALPSGSTGLRLMYAMRVPFFCAKNRQLLDVLDQTRSFVPLLFRQPPAVRDALRTVLEPPLVRELRNKVWRAAGRLVLRQGALTAAHFVEAVKSSRKAAATWRSVRGDHEELAHAYLQIFEAASYALAFHAVVENAATRGDPLTSPATNGESLAAICKWDAKDREPLANGALGLLFSEISRVTRNKIGHNAAHYDFSSGMITFDNGKQISLLELQAELLDTYRLACWATQLVALVELISAAADVHEKLQWEPEMENGGRTVFRRRR